MLSVSKWLLVSLICERSRELVWVKNDYIAERYAGLFDFFAWAIRTSLWSDETLDLACENDEFWDVIWLGRLSQRDV